MGATSLTLFGVGCRSECFVPIPSGSCEHFELYKVTIVSYEHLVPVARLSLGPFGSPYGVSDVILYPSFSIEQWKILGSTRVATWHRVDMKELTLWLEKYFKADLESNLMQARVTEMFPSSQAREQLQGDDHAEGCGGILNLNMMALSSRRLVLWSCHRSFR